MIERKQAQARPPSAIPHNSAVVRIRNRTADLPSFVCDTDRISHGKWCLLKGQVTGYLKNSLGARGMLKHDRFVPTRDESADDDGGPLGFIFDRVVE